MQGIWGKKCVRWVQKSKFTCFFAEPQPFLCKKCGNGGDFKQMLGVGDTKCGIYKPKRGIYKPYCAVRRIGTNFVASLWTSGRTDCEVEAGFYEVWLYGKRIGVTFRQGKLHLGIIAQASLASSARDLHYLCSVDVGRADPEKPNSKESKERKGLRFYE